MRADEPEPTRRLDVRGIDGEPFGDIVAALDDLGTDETLRLVNSFEPEPLYGVLEDRGFACDGRQVDDDLWHVDVTRAE